MEKQATAVHDTLSGQSQTGYAGYGNVVTEADRVAWREAYAARAQESFHRGQTALEEGHFQDARFWLERAGRMARASPNITWSLALVEMESGHYEEALAHLADLRKRFHLREAAFLEVLCLAKLRRWEGAVERLHAALSVSVIMPDLHAIANDVSAQSGRGGWCCASNAGTVHVVAEGRVRIALDGRPVGVGRSGRHVLPAEWVRARRVAVTVRGRHLLGSPIDVAALTRAESLLVGHEKGLTGWIWYPAEPEYTPNIRLWDGCVRAVSEPAQNVESDVPLARPRCFTIPWTALPDPPTRLLMVRDDHDRPLTGAPIMPVIGRLVSGQTAFLPPDLQPVPVVTSPSKISQTTGQATGQAASGCSVVIPVYRNRKVTLDCLERVLATVSADVRVIVVEDATPEPDLASALDDLARSDRIELVRLPYNQGFPAAANAGLRLAAGQDVILLNSDTLVPEGWVERLLRRLRRPGVGTVTPFSNDASILSYPSVEAVNPVPNPLAASRLDRLCQRLFNDEEAMVDLPTANGFCMAISAACLERTGLLRANLFGQGYGEENDFCLRATALGFRHRPAPDVYVLHQGSVSFGQGRRWLMARNLTIVNALHPGYEAMVAAFMARDPLQPWRRRLDRARLASEVPRRRHAVAMVVHAAGGGVERVVRERAQAFEAEGIAAYALRPTEAGCRVTRTGLPSGHRAFVPDNLSFALPTEQADLVATLSELGVQHFEWHQMIGHAPEIRTLHEKLGVPYDVYLHDHVWFCPRVSLLDGHGHYCGEPDIAGCEQCVSCWGDVLAEGMNVAERVKRSHTELASARSRIVPSHDTAQRFMRHFPGLSFTVRPLEDDRRLLSESPLSVMSPPVLGRRLRICVIGGIGQWKGYDVLLGMAQEIQAQALPVELVLVGHTPNDDALLAAGVVVTGEYREEEALKLIHDQHADLGFIPSVAPETWCYALSWLWRAGLEVVCFDLGAQAERVRRGKGVVVPLALSSSQLLSFILRRWYQQVRGDGFTPQQRRLE